MAATYRRDIEELLVHGDDLFVTTFGCYVGCSRMSTRLPR